MLPTFQTKIDSLIVQANHNMLPQSQNEIVSVIQYSQALDLLEFTSKSYHIQQTEIMVSVSLCWEVLGNPKQALDYITKALAIVPNQPSLILYKSILLLSLNSQDDSQRSLLKYKQLDGNNNTHIFYYDTFRILFYYVLKYEDEVILSEINEYLSKYDTNSTKGKKIGSNSSFAAIYYIRAVLYSNCASKHQKIETKHQLLQNYKENINKANRYQRNDTGYYIQEGISKENLSKAFMLLYPHIIQYKPRVLIDYKHMTQGFGLFYVLFKAVKLFKIKLKRKKIKVYYIQQLKVLKKSQSKEKDSSSESNDGNAKCSQYITNNNNRDDSLNYKISTCKIPLHRRKNDWSSDRFYNDDNGSTGNNTKNQCNRIEQIKREFQEAIRKLYKSVWVFNYPIVPPQKANDTIHLPQFESNFFIRNGYYSSQNIKEAIIKGLSHNEDYNSKLNQQHLQQQQKRIELKQKNNHHSSASNITNGNNSSNAKTEPSAPSQISTSSNAKKNEIEEPIKTIHQHYSAKEIKSNQSYIPIQLNYQTETKSHSNERNTNLNPKSQCINLIDVSDHNKLVPIADNNNNSSLPIETNKIREHNKISAIELPSKFKQIPNSKKSIKNNNELPTSLLCLKKKIPQSTNATNLLGLVSKKSNQKMSNASIEKFIKYRNIQSAHKFHMSSLSKDNDHSNSTNANCFNSNLTQIHKTLLVQKDTPDINNRDMLTPSTINKMSINFKTKHISPTSTNLGIEDSIIKLNKKLFIKRKQPKESNTILKRMNSSTKKEGEYHIKHNYSFSSKKDESSLVQMIHQLNNRRNTKKTNKSNDHQ